MMGTLQTLLIIVYSVFSTVAASIVLPLARLGLPLSALLVLVFVIQALLFLLCGYGLYRLLRRLPRNVLVRGGTVLATVLVLAFGISYASRLQRPRPLTFDGQSTALTRTQFVPTLDTPVEPGKNAVWCASFQAAWKTLQDGLAQGPVDVDGADAFCAKLNASPSPEVPDRSLYATAGRVSEGITEKIRRELSERFPKAAPADFGPLAPDSLVVFAHLESRCAFTIPYFDSVTPTTFTDSTGKTTAIRTFGLRPKDQSAYMKLRRQLCVLVRKGAVAERPEDFAVDLCRDSADTQVVFARVPACASLRDALAMVDSDIAQKPTDQSRYDSFGANDVLLVPELAYRVQHHFAEIERHVVRSGPLDGVLVDTARQDVMFRLDRAGIELMSQAVLSLRESSGGPMVGDRPFLVYLKKRGANVPYFVMWVDNAELLTAWGEKKS